MNVRVRSKWTTVGLNVRALAVGVMVATVLVVGYTLATALVTERAAGELIVPPESQALFALLITPFDAALLAIICAPAWLLMARLGWAHSYTAAVLGFVAVEAFWTIDNIEGTVSVLELMRSGLVYGLCGAIAGLTTWWARPGP